MNARRAFLDALGFALLLALLAGCGGDDSSLQSFSPARGILDTSFGGKGFVTSQFGPASDHAEALYAFPDGRSIAVGYTQPQNGPYQFAFGEYAPSGIPFSTFNGSGVANVSLTSNNCGAAAIAVQADGKVVAAGYAQSTKNDFGIVRLLPTGAPDPYFGTQGKVVVPVSDGQNQAQAIALLGDGSLLVAGYANNAANHNADFAIVKLQTNGALDTSFGMGGKVIVDLGSAYDYAHALSVQSDGKIVLAGESSAKGTFDMAVLRLLPSGAVDTSYGDQGKVFVDFAGGVDGAFAMVLDGSDRAVLAGHAGVGTDDAAIARLNPDGNLDASFGGGKVHKQIGAVRNDINAIAIQPDGNLVIAGDAADKDKLNVALVRYRPDGSLDQTFGNAGVALSALGYGDDTANAVSVLPSGKILVAGSSRDGNATRFVVARFQ